MSLFEIKKITVGPETIVATVVLDEAAPLMTSDDQEGTQLVYGLMPQIADHACVSERGDVFRNALPSTETAHLLEHVTVELMSRLDMEDISAGNTSPVEGAERTWNIRLSCPNDVLVCGALGCATFILNCAFSGHMDGVDIDEFVEALRSLTVDLPVPSRP